MSKKKAELYVHIPFCKKKCEYCDFLSAVPHDFSETERYIAALLAEAEEKSADLFRYEITSVFFGGGTPSILTAGQLDRMLAGVLGFFQLTADAEITMECNPGTVDQEKLDVMYRNGVNRISFGLQSCHENELKLLGRIHNWNDFLKSYYGARAAGIENINVDLMYGLPNQSLADWKDTLFQTASLDPEHISAYNLMIEEGTPFYDRYAEDERKKEVGDEPMELPSEETDNLMSLRTEEILAGYGYHRYEFSNYSKPNKECRHNIGYWTGVEYLGLGLGASSYMKEHQPADEIQMIRLHPEVQKPDERSESERDEFWRFSNTRDLESYLKGNFRAAREVKLSLENQMEEFVFLGLRMTEGISKSEFQKRFGICYDTVYQEVTDRLQQHKLLAVDADRVALTTEGINISNRVLSEFLL